LTSYVFHIPLQQESIQQQSSDLSRFRIQTPVGSFPIFANEIRPNLVVATLVFYTKQPGGPKYEGDLGILEADHHMEEGETQARALEKIKSWAGERFGEPCDISPN
jgi:hypothetical protein